MGEQIAFDIHSAAIWYSLGVTFMSVHYFLEHGCLVCVTHLSLSCHTNCKVCDCQGESQALGRTSF